MEYIISLLLSVASELGFILLASACLEWRVSKRTFQNRRQPGKRTRFLAAWGFTACFSFVFVNLYDGLPYTKILWLLALHVVLQYLFWTGSFLSMLSVAAIHSAVSNASECVVCSMIWYVAKIDYTTFLAVPIYFILGAFFTYALSLAVHLYFRHLFLREKGLRRSWRGWSRLLIPCAVLLLFDVFITDFILENGMLTIQLTATILLFIASVILYIAKDSRASIFAQLHQKNEQTLLQQNREQRAVLHDTANLSLTVGALLENGQPEQALALTRQLTEHCTPATRYVSTQNPTVDAVLNDQCAKAAAAGIQLFVEVCPLQNLAMQELDIVVLFSNLLDNARNACLACEGARRIAIQAVPSPTGYVRLTVRNTCAPTPPQRAPRPFSARAEAHGYGQKNIRRVMARYDCSCDFAREGDQYRAIVLLPCLPESGKKE